VEAQASRETESVLIVEDDPALRRSLHTTLDALGFETVEARTSEEALALLRVANYDVVLLDVNLPGMGGVEACKRIRRLFPRLPVLMLTVRDAEEDKVEGLEAGADDYVTKPFQIRELAARIRGIIRRYQAPELPSEWPLQVGEISLDPARRRVERSGTEVKLTPREFEALRFLMERAGRPVSHARLLNALCGPEGEDRREYLRVLIGQIRKKIEADPAQPAYLLTDSHFGYRFRAP
jgi:two-component system KDP operon response regulator KdpE